MNRERIEYCIELMRGASALDMTDFQSGGAQATTVEELHSCGNTACFAGYVALSDRFQADGGIVDEGFPQYGSSGFGHLAIAEWLGISARLADAIVHGSWRGLPCVEFYPVPFEDVKPHHVIEKLQAVLSGELT